MARDHLQSSGEKKKSDTPSPTTLPNWLQTDFLNCVCHCVCVCVFNHWAPGRVAFRLKAAPVKIRILYPLSFILYCMHAYMHMYTCALVVHHQLMWWLTSMYIMYRAHYTYTIPIATWCTYVCNWEQQRQTGRLQSIRVLAWWGVGPHHTVRWYLMS